MTRILLVLVAMLGCGHPTANVVQPVASSALDGWWEVADVEAAGVFGGAAIRIAGGELDLVMPSIPAFEQCRATIEGDRVSIAGCGQDTSATLGGDELQFADGFHARRAEASRRTALEAAIDKVRRTCDRARACFHAAGALIDVGDEASLFGPLLRADACANIPANLASDLRDAHRDVPAACAITP